MDVKRFGYDVKEVGEVVESEDRMLDLSEVSDAVVWASSISPATDLLRLLD